MRKVGLQFRIGLLIFGLSALFIAVFTTIQLRDQIDRLNSYNKYRARVGTIIVKTTLELLLKDIHTEETAPTIFEIAIQSFSSEGIVEKISVFSMKGETVATNDPVMREFGESKSDIDTYKELSKASSENAWFYSTLNRNTQLIDIYIPLSIEASIKYIVKLSFSIGNIRQAIISTFVPIVLTVVAVLIGNMFLGYILLRTIVWPIRLLNVATRDIASGNLDLNVNIQTNDEIQELGEIFNDMTVALKKMKNKAENANPLTKLPGNTTIREEIERRIKTDEKFVAIHVDLNDFKAYNDKYGIAKGDEVIKFTSQILGKSMKDSGNAKDFIGHEGGDDFFVLTTPDKAEALAAQIINEFDANIKNFYSETDLKAGYISARNRKGEFVRFPIMSISLAGVTNQFRPISSYGELTNIAVEVKTRAKMEGKSVFFLDRRRSDRRDDPR
jgi:diguanylate cyclase (GGDEF)-like protein